MPSAESISKIARIVVFVAAFASLAGSVYLSAAHEPDNETVEISVGKGEETVEIVSDALSYHFVFTGEKADAVSWDFGDGTYADAFEVYKGYTKAGEYNILCTAANVNGERVCGYHLTIEEKDYGFFDGYSLEIALLLLSAVLMAITYWWPSLYGRFTEAVPW